VSFAVFVVGYLACGLLAAGWANGGLRREYPQPQFNHRPFAIGWGIGCGPLALAWCLILGWRLRDWTLGR
jgi:hypothetical protein